LGSNLAGTAMTALFTCYKEGEITIIIIIIIIIIIRRRRRRRSRRRRRRIKSAV
jgi:hypothetical protein